WRILGLPLVRGAARHAAQRYTEINAAFHSYPRSLEQVMSWLRAVSTPDVEQRSTTTTVLLPPWRVLLHNDDYNSMEHVIRALLLTVQSLTPEEAVSIMLEAHTEGVALV